MRCKHCDHVLWNQPAPIDGAQRVCSECGEPYQPTDFSFERGKVRCCCPHCNTGYYGTSREGHLEPAEFACVQCGCSITMNDCVIRPHDETRELEAMQRVDVPWIASGRDGRFKRWWRTSTLGFTNAGRLASMLTRDPAPMRAARFLLINALLAVTIGGGFLVLMRLFTGNNLFSVTAGGDIIALIAGIAIMAGSAVSLLFFAAIPAFLAASLAGLIALSRRSDHPHRPACLRFARAYELICYSSGALLLSLVPCCGTGFGAIWWLVQSAQAMIGAFESESIYARILAAVVTVVGFIIGIGCVIAVNVMF
ncbi:MAG: hypothetical protein WCI96_02600 [Planctomycetota bacterium]